MPESGLRVGVAFGGRSVEHDVSIITGLQALEVLSERHRPVPIYIARSGRWFTGEKLRDLACYQRLDGGDPDAQQVSFDLHGGRLAVAGGGSVLRGRRSAAVELDVVVIATHGTQGEDGCLTGALELAQLPYVGPGVGAAAAAMDKVMTKSVLAGAGLPALDHMALRRESFQADREGMCAHIAARWGGPWYLKPCSLGSSVGVSRCADARELSDGLELAFELDRVCIAEPALEGGMEINCAVLGRPGVEPRTSVCEQPVAGEDFLSFEDKYMQGGKGEGMKGAQRLVPAPIEETLSAMVRSLAARAFTAFGCAGVTRVDFLIDGDGEVFVNELNTVPGSFSFYLWEPAGLPFVELMDELLDGALAEHAERELTTTVFATNLLAQRVGGAKGARA